ncbi:DNA polymerase III subunit beta [Sciscionella marina]|uniref:DNA polymerase III subunit beta n=1 Tax=Sciscionella marina TaxID=508770 RepID=UPI00036CD472|nr:DNA polymerase III subunit beta [Sciscionella marina]
MEFTTSRTELDAACSAAVRLLPARRTDPVLSGLLLHAGPAGLRLAAVDQERALVNDIEAMVHTEGSALVPGKPFAETVHALEAEQVQVRLEQQALVLRTPGARFSLPLMSLGLHPGVREPPPVLGELDAARLAEPLAVVAGACSGDLALPMFTGVRLRGQAGTLRMTATDRYQLAVADLPWDGADFDVLVPGKVLGEVTRRATGTVRLHGTVQPGGAMDRFALGWSGGVVSTALLATPFIDEQRYLDEAADAVVELEAEALAGAVRRAGLFADGRGAVLLDLGEDEVRVRATAEEGAGFGTASETVKASVTGQLAQHFRSAYLLGALRGFGSATVRMRVLDGMRRTLLSSPDVPELRYVIMPIVGR